MAISIEEKRKLRSVAREIVNEASEKPIAFALRMLLGGIDGVLRCYIKNYPTEKCKMCSFKWMCKSLYDLREEERLRRR